jgi:hypothetical protein
VCAGSLTRRPARPAAADEAGPAELARAGVRASFADDAVKSRILAEIDARASRQRS